MGGHCAKCSDLIAAQSKRKARLGLLSCLFFPVTFPIALVQFVIGLFRGEWPSDTDGKGPY